MSIKRMTAVWETANAEGSELLLLLALADHANDQGVCWPGYDSLSAKVRLGRRQVRRIMDKLQNKAEVIVAQNAGRGNTNMYLVTAGVALEDIEATLTKRLGFDQERAGLAVTVVRTVRNKGVGTPFSADEKGVYKTEKGVCRTGKGGPQTPRTIMNPKESSKGNGASAPPPTSDPSTFPVAGKSQPVDGEAELSAFLGPRDHEPAMPEATHNYAVPVVAGGDEPAVDVILAEVCRFNFNGPPDNLQEKNRAAHRRCIDEIVRKWAPGVRADQARLSMQVWAARNGWKTEANVFSTSFEEGFGMILTGVTAGTITAVDLATTEQATEREQSPWGNLDKIARV